MQMLIGTFDFLEFIQQPWHWSISGIAIVLVMTLLLFFGGEFGVSYNFKTLCTIGGAGKCFDFFDFDWKIQLWNLFFALGAIIGGFIAYYFLRSPEPVQIADTTIVHLQTLGVETPSEIEEGLGYVPNELFSIAQLGNPKVLLFLSVGGFLIGFGTRYAGGCTSGHAISGLSNFQLPSFIAVVGFFIGGLLMTHLILPLILPF